MALHRKHSFHECAAIGDRVARIMDGILSKRYVVNPVPVWVELDAGIDRTLNDGRTVEYKADMASTRTGNYFIELYSDEELQRPGWALKSQADMLFICSFPNKSTMKVLLTTPNAIRARLDDWGPRFPRGRGRNDGYRSQGLLVPVHVVDATGKVYYYDIEQDKFIKEVVP